jgi:hypothetical protein
MEIKLKNTPEQVELIKAMGSKNPQVSYEAAAALATYIGPVIKQVLQTAGTVSQIYKDFPFVEDSDASIPLDLFWREKAGFVTVWSQNSPGGLPTSQVSDVGELKFSTYTLNSAVSFNKKFARKSNLTVVSAAIEKMIQEVLIKQEQLGWSVILKALAEASTRTVKTVPGGTNPAKHVIAAATANSFVLADLNKLLTRIKRINESFSGNTAVQPYSSGITDLYVSPEIKEQIRAFTFNPIDTSANNTKQNLPEDLRMQIWNAGGMQSIFGINLVEMIEFGDGEKYNELFDFFTTGQSVPGSNGGAWQAADQILVGVDNSRRALYRPVETSDDENNSEFNVKVDNQFASNGDRTDSKVGWYGQLTEGRVCADARVLVGVAV